MRTLLAILVALAFARTSAQQTATNDPAVRFHAVDVYVDSNVTPLAAYQLEFSVISGDAKIVGIEGGEHPAFSNPPFYDPKAMQHERVVIAAFSTASPDHLPVGKTRVAVIHVQTSEQAAPRVELKLRAAADSNGNKIPAEGNAQERKTK